MLGLAWQNMRAGQCSSSHRRMLSKLDHVQHKQLFLGGLRELTYLAQRTCGYGVNVQINHHKLPR